MNSLAVLMLGDQPDVWAWLVHCWAKRVKKSEDNKRYRKVNAAQIKQRRKEQHARHPFVTRNRAAKWYEENTERAKNNAKSRHQLSVCAAAPRPRPDICECCGKTQPGRALSFDHCHDSGEFRGWLCVQCNVGIGALGDTEEGLMRAIAYLKKAKA